jgi:transcriptional regulator with XRE-family HTH domain
MDKRKTRLLEELKDKEYRDAYVSSGVDVGIAFQIRALRKQIPLTQAQLAEKANMKQERISALENPSNSPSITTLKKLANALDIGLVVKFVPISKLVEWELNLSPDSLKVMSYEHDSYFKEDITEEINETFLKEIGQTSIQGNVTNFVEWREKKARSIKEALDIKQQKTQAGLSEQAQSKLAEMMRGDII